MANLDVLVESREDPCRHAFETQTKYRDELIWKVLPVDHVDGVVVYQNPRIQEDWIVFKTIWDMAAKSTKESIFGLLTDSLNEWSDSCDAAPENEEESIKRWSNYLGSFGAKKTLKAMKDRLAMMTDEYLNHLRY
jgi:hypothetical protein